MRRSPSLSPPPSLSPSRSLSFHLPPSLSPLPLYERECVCTRVESTNIPVPWSSLRFQAILVIARADGGRHLCPQACETKEWGRAGSARRRRGEEQGACVCVCVCARARWRWKRSTTVVGTQTKLLCLLSPSSLSEAIYPLSSACMPGTPHEHAARRGAILACVPRDRLMPCMQTRG